MTDARRRRPRTWFELTWALARRPRLWPIAVRQALRFRRRVWWRRRPFLPVPDPELIRFRMVTAYGGTGEGLPDPDDVVTWLEWCRNWPSRASDDGSAASPVRGFPGG